jgi:hypothetical protein
MNLVEIYDVQRQSTSTRAALPIPLDLRRSSLAIVHDAAGSFPFLSSFTAVAVGGSVAFELSTSVTLEAPTSWSTSCASSFGGSGTAVAGLSSGSGAALAADAGRGAATAGFAAGPGGAGGRGLALSPILLKVLVLSPEYMSGLFRVFVRTAWSKSLVRRAISLRTVTSWSMFISSYPRIPWLIPDFVSF